MATEASSTVEAASSEATGGPDVIITTVTTATFESLEPSFTLKVKASLPVVSAFGV
jgi:hypothetical protein